MRKFTRHIKKHRKNITLKRGGYNHEREGIIDIANKAASKALTTVGDVGLRTLGLERINNHQNNPDYQFDNINNVDNNGQVLPNVIGSVNKVLDSEIVNNTVKETAKDTAQIIGKLASHFNDAMEDPMIKSKIEKSIKNAGVLSDIAVESFKEPFNKAVNNLVETTNEAAPKFGKAVGKAMWDTVTAIPPISVVGDLINITNDVTKATSAAVDAGTQAIVTASDTFIDTKENITKVLNTLEDNKKLAHQISSRTTNSINNFENPLKSSLKSSFIGGRKSRRKLINRRSKTGHVKFNI
jgi:hypothetical protein